MGDLGHITIRAFFDGATLVAGAAAPISAGPPDEFWYLYLALAFALAVAVGIGVTVYLLNVRLRSTVMHLAASESRLHQITEQSRTVYWEMDTAGLYTYVSDSAREVFGYRPEELVGKKHYFDLFAPDRREALIAEVEEIVSARQVVEDHENHIVRKDGSIIMVSTHCAPIFGVGGEFLGYRGSDLDITDRVEAHAAMRESEARLRYAMEATQDGLWDWNLVTGETVLAPRVYEMMGYRPDEFRMTSESWAERVHPDDFEDAMSAMQRGLTGPDKTGFAEYRIPHKDGGYLWVLARGKLVEEAPDGEPLRVVGTLVDITERKEAQEALATERARLTAFIEHAPAAVAMFDHEMRYLAWSQRWLNDYGLEEYHLLGRSHYEVFPEIGNKWKDIHQRCLRGDVHRREEELFVRRDGAEHWLCWEVRPWHLPDGSIGGIIMYTEDVTERKRDTAALEASDALFESLSANVPGVIYQFRAWPDGRTIVPYVSEGVRELYGVSPEELREDARIMVERVHPDDRTRVIESIQASFVSLEVWAEEFRVITPKGEVLWLQGRSRPKAQDDGSVLWHGSITDISERRQAQIELETSEERFRRMFELGLVGVAVAGLDCKVIHANERFCEILGRTADELKNFEWTELTHPDDVDKDIRNYEAMLAGELDRYDTEKRFLRPDGSSVHIKLSASCLRDSSGQITECISFIDDISERKQAQFELETSEERFRSFFEIGLIGMALGTPDKKSVLFNDCLCEMTGYSRDELALMPWTDLTHPDDLAEDLAQFERMLGGAMDGYTLDKRMIRKDGTIVFVTVSARAVRGPDGEVVHTIALIEDITARRETQAALEERDALFAKLSENVPGAIYQLQMWPDGTLAFQYVSEGARDMYEVSPEEAVGNTSIIFERTHPDDLERVINSIRHSFESLEVWSEEFRIVTPIRGVRWMHGRSRPEKEADGSVIWYGHTTDITERKLAEEEANQNERRAQRQRVGLANLVVSESLVAGDLAMAKGLLAEVAARTLDVARASLWKFSDDGTELVCFELFELDSGEHSEGTVLCSEDYLPYFEGIRRFGRIVAHDAQTDPWTACFTESYLKPLGITSMLDAGYHLDGRLSGVVCLEHTGEPRTWQADEESFVTTLAAMTAQLLASAERTRAEAALATRDALFAKLSDNVPGFLMQFQMWPDGRSGLPFASEGIRNTFEIEPETLRDDAASIWERVHPEDIPAVREDVERSMATGELWSQTFRAVLPSRGVRWMRGQARPEPQEDGSTIWHGYVSDITEQVEAFEERRLLEQQFERTQRLESLGVMAGGIAHDFNNILMAVLANAEMIQRELPPDSPAVRPLSEIHAAADRAAELCRQMLAYAGKSSMVSEQIQIGRLVHDLTQLLRASISKKVTLDVDESPGAPPVEGDASQIGQIVMNLIINAAESIGENGGTVTVRVLPCALREGESMRLGYDEVLPAGPYCLLEVSDDGCGMDADTRARIFEPFFTTKFTGRGLGLAAVLGIVRAHNGALSVKSKPGEGTKFRVLFPATVLALPAANDTEPPVDEAPFHWGGGVLLVDDETALRIVGQRMLERIGCRVWTAEDGLVGLEQYRAHADDIDLVILDLTMPNMDGHETLAELRKLDPALPVIIASGFSAEDLASRFEGQHITGTLQKPFGYRKLEAAVRAFVARKQMV